MFLNWLLVNCLQLLCLLCQFCTPSPIFHVFQPSLLHPAPPSHPCCHTKPVFLYTASFCWSHKYPILPRTPACYCCLYKSADLHHRQTKVNQRQTPDQLWKLSSQLNQVNKGRPRRDQTRWAQSQGLANSGQSLWPVIRKGNSVFLHCYKKGTICFFVLLCLFILDWEGLACKAQQSCPALLCSGWAAAATMSHVENLYLTLKTCVSN